MLGGARLGALTHGAGSLHRAGCEYVRAGERQDPTFRLTPVARQLAAKMWIRGGEWGEGGPGVEPGPHEFTKRWKSLTARPALLSPMPVHPD